MNTATFVVNKKYRFPFKKNAIPNWCYFTNGESVDDVISHYGNGQWNTDGRSVLAFTPHLGDVIYLDANMVPIITNASDRTRYTQYIGVLVGSDCGKGTVVNGSVYLRSEASMDGTPITAYSAGTELSWIGESTNGEWYGLTDGTNVGYCYQSYIYSTGTEGMELEYDVYEVTEQAEPEPEPYYGNRWSIRETTAQDIADAIREKTGSTAEIKGEDIADAIRGIQSGGNSDCNCGHIAWCLKSQDYIVGELNVLEV